MKRTENGTFAKGNTGGGRPKGSKNKATEDLRGFIGGFLAKNIDKLQEDFDALEPKERIDTVIKLMEYSIPKLSRTQIEEESPVDHTEIDYSKLSDSTLEELESEINRLNEVQH